LILLNSLQFNGYVLTGRLNGISACCKANTKTQIQQEDSISTQQQNNKRTKYNMVGKSNITEVKLVIPLQALTGS